MALLGDGLEVWQVSLKLNNIFSHLNTSLQYRPTKKKNSYSILSLPQFLQFAKEMAADRGIGQEHLPTYNWYYDFIRRHPQLRLQVPKKREDTDREKAKY